MECCYPWKQCIEVHVTKDDSTIEKKFHRQIVSFWGNQQDDRDCKTKLCLITSFPLAIVAIRKSTDAVLATK